MARYNFVNPGAAAGNAIEQFFIQREAEKRQRMLDQLMQERQAADISLRGEDLDLARQSEARIAAENEAAVRAAVEKQRADRLAKADSDAMQFMGDEADRFADARRAEVAHERSLALEAERGRQDRLTNAQKPQATSRETEPLIAVMGEDGQPVLMPRSQAAGKRPASTREQGRPVLSSDANRVADFDTSLDDLQSLRKALTKTEGSTGASAQVGAGLWNVITEFTGIGEEAKQRQGSIDLVKQVIGKALEGGVLRKEDEAKYARILPTIGDPPEVAQSKLDGLEQEIIRRRQVLLENLGASNYDVSRFPERSAEPKTETPEQRRKRLYEKYSR